MTVESIKAEDSGYDGRQSTLVKVLSCHPDWQDWMKHWVTFENGEYVSYFHDYSELYRGPLLSKAIDAFKHLPEEVS